MRPALLSLGIAPLSLLLVLGCSSSQLGTSDTNSAGGAPPAAVCTAPGYATDSAPTALTEVDATISDPSGKALTALPVQVCGIDKCINGMSGKAGATAVKVNTSLTRPAFKYGDGFDYAELAVQLGKEAKQDLGKIVALPLPAFADGAAFPKSGNVTNGDVTLSLAAGVTVVHDTLTYEDDTDLVLRSVAIPVADSTQALDPSFNFELGYALAPLGTTFCPAAQLSLKNSLNWDPGTEVEIFIQGLDVAEGWAPYGTWLQVAEGSVSADGSSIDSTSGGIPILSAVAVRRKK